MNDKTFEIDFDAYLKGFDSETKDLLDVEPDEGEKFLNIKGIITTLKAKKVLFGYTKLWSEIDLLPFNNSEITTLEEHIKRKWADISAETAGEQYTPDDVIALISEIIASKIEETETLLKIYDCTCGGGNLLFGVEDRIHEKFKRLTQTFGQDWNDALYALAKIESRFRADSKIEHGNTLVDDKYYNEEFEVVVANPPYGVSWKGYESDIRKDKTNRFAYLPSISDGQLLFMQHLISKMSVDGVGVVVHNGSTLFSGDAGSSESNIRKFMLDTDIVEAVIQLPTDEFFNTGIYTYLWVLNKNKKAHQKDKVMLLNASEKFKELKNEPGALISPRPKQKFGTDKIMSKIDEFLAHEHEDDYFEKLLEKQLTGVSESKKKELLEKRKAYSNNKNIYSLLLQYAAGFGKSNIIGWTALQLKDLRIISNGKAGYVYDKIFIIVDRIQLRSQIDSKMLNMNIDKNMFVEAKNKKTFLEALNSDTRLVIVNLQKFGSVKEIMDSEVLQSLAKKRVVFLIDEIHRSHSGDQNEEMVSIFDELQAPFDNDPAYQSAHKKKNLIVGFTATPDDNALARFGEFGKYAENEKLWVPFDAYTMREAIEDEYILNPIDNIVPVASKMLFDKPKNKLKGFVEKEYKDVDKKQVYENRERINAIAEYVADLLVKDVYRQIRGTGKAMLAVYSIKAAIAYKDAVTKHYKKLVKESKYQRYADAPIYVIYSGNQDEQNASNLNDGLSEEKILQNFALKKNGLMIVVAKLQTGFDEKKLHTLFLDKEVRDISAIQAISRVNRITKYKNDCKIVDFSYNNVNMQNIKDAFEHFSDVVVSDFDPFSDKRVLEILFTDLNKSDIYEKFFERFTSIFKDKIKRDDPVSYLAYENSLEKYINANPKRAADTKTKSAQYFTILNRIEYVIEIDKKYSDSAFLFFWRKFNTLYNALNRSEDTKDPIEVYFDNQIGIIEAETHPTEDKKKKPTQVAQAPGEYTTNYQFDILKVIEARNAQEAIVGTLIQEFAAKIEDLFEYVRNSIEGRRLIIKIKSHISENEIYDDFAKIYRRYRALNRQKVGDYFFKETEDLVDKLCDDFEVTLRKESL